MRRLALTVVVVALGVLPVSGAAITIAGATANSPTPIKSVTQTFSQGASAVVSCAGPLPRSEPLGTHLSISVTLGAYEATLTGSVIDDSGGFLRMNSPSVTLSYAAKAIGTYQLFDEPGSWYQGGLGYTTKAWAGPSGAATDSVLCLAHFDHKADAQVLVPLDEPSQCCNFESLFTIEDLGGLGFSDALETPNLGFTGGSLVVEHGTALLIGADPRFTGVFTDFAGTASPVRVFTIGNFGLIDVTRQWPSLIAKDAASDLERFDLLLRNGKPQDTRGILAAWTADECEVDRCSAAFALVSQKLAAGDAAPFEGSPSAYLALLRHDLSAWHYVAGTG